MSESGGFQKLSDIQIGLVRQVSNENNGPVRYIFVSIQYRSGMMKMQSKKGLRIVAKLLLDYKNIHTDYKERLSNKLYALNVT